MEQETEADFASMGLDDRILKAIVELGWERPTLIQEQFIPLAMEGKDVLARGRTGSGKTAAFAIPIIHSLLQHKNRNAMKRGVGALVLTPTKELARQVNLHFSQLCSGVSRQIRVVDLAAQGDSDTQKALLEDAPDVVAGTPGRVALQVEAGHLRLDALRFLVVDEADLIFSFGFQSDIEKIAEHLPEIYQAFLTSATLNDDAKALKKLLLHNPVTLKLKEAQLPSSSQLTQYHIKCEEEDKFVLIYALLKLGLIKGKSIIFVGSVDRCYRLKLFLQQFGIPTCALNAEMPVNSRCHIVEQFNEGLYQYLVASDEKTLEGPELGESEEGSEEIKKKKRKYRNDKESGVSRGIDFHHVSNVINFDFPPTVDAYIHRVGRTARGYNRGTALSFATDEELPVLEKVSEVLSEQIGGDSFKPYQFRMAELDGFRYRARDMLRACTGAAVRETRLAEIKAEIFRSKKLKAFFAQNPRDLDVLRHDKTLHVVKEQEHLKDVPDYIVPPSLKGVVGGPGKRTRRSRRDKDWKPTVGAVKYQKKKGDPLQSFECPDSD